MSNNGAVLAPAMTPPVFKTYCCVEPTWAAGADTVAIVTTGLWGCALADTTVDIPDDEVTTTPAVVIDTVEAVGTAEAEEGFGKSWGCPLDFCAADLAAWGTPGTPLTTAVDTEVGLEEAAGCRVYWIPPCWITVGVEVRMAPGAMVITGWGLKMKLFCCWGCCCWLTEAVFITLFLRGVAVAGWPPGGPGVVANWGVEVAEGGAVGKAEPEVAWKFPFPVETLVSVRLLVPKISSAVVSSDPRTWAESLEAEVPSKMEAAALAAWSCNRGESSWKC